MLKAPIKEHYNAMHPNTQFKLHSKSDRILMCDARGDSVFRVLCTAPEGKKYSITKTRNLNKKLEFRIDAVLIVCPQCKKLTNDLGHCTTKFGCFYF